MKRIDPNSRLGKFIQHAVMICAVVALSVVLSLVEGCAITSSKTWNGEGQLTAASRSMGVFSGKVRQEATSEGGVKSSINREGLSDNGAATVGQVLEAAAAALKAMP